MKISCVIAVHNEEKYLPYSLPSLIVLPFDEILFVLDRCTDASEKLIRKIATSKTRIIHKKHKTWNNSCAESKWIGCKLAQGDIVFILDADLVLDRKLLEKTLSNWEDGILLFTYKNYTLMGSFFQRIHDEFVNFMALIIRKSGIQPERSGLYAIKKEIAKIEDFPSEYDLLQRKHKTKLIKTNILHLRPGLSKEKQINQGITRARLPQYNLLKILLASFLEFKPYMLISYLKGR